MNQKKDLNLIHQKTAKITNQKISKNLDSQKEWLQKWALFLVAKIKKAPQTAALHTTVHACLLLLLLLLLLLNFLKVCWEIFREIPRGNSYGIFYTITDGHMIKKTL